MKHYKISEKPLRVPHVKTKHRTIKTDIPAPSWQKLIKRVRLVEGRALYGGQLPVVWERAVGYQVSDPDGNTWIDFTSTIFVSNAGHAHPKIIAAIKKQLNQKLLTSYNYITEIRAKFLETLLGMLPKFAERALLFSAGTEATECAVPIMRLNGRKTRRSKIAIITFRGNMHGATMGAEILKGNKETMDAYAYRDPNIHYLDFPFAHEVNDKKYDWKKRFQSDLATLLKRDKLNPNDICGFMLESFRGWAAAFFPKAYIQELMRFAKSHKAIVAFDDIQGGFGRTGKLFSFEYYGVEPDLVFLGKGISSSLPLSAVVGRAKYINLAAEGSLHSTHSGNPVSLAAGLANLNIIKSERLVARSAKLGKILHKRLREIKAKFPEHIHAVLGAGLIAGIHFKNPKTHKPDGAFASRVVEKALQRGLLLVHTGRESIKIAPPLTISEDALREGLAVLEEAVAEIARKK